MAGRPLVPRRLAQGMLVGVAVLLMVVIGLCDWRRTLLPQGGGVLPRDLQGTPVPITSRWLYQKLFVQQRLGNLQHLQSTLTRIRR